AGGRGPTRPRGSAAGRRGVRGTAVGRGGVAPPRLGAGGVPAARSREEGAARGPRLAAYQYFMPIKRISQPEEQAAALAFLASDEASYINGVALDVNGGLFMA